VLFLIAILMPNSLELMQRYAPALYFEPAKPTVASAQGETPAPPRRLNTMVLTWNRRWAMLIAAFLIFGILGLSRPSEFLYWQF
jgi:hypothetical protein